MGDSGVTAVVLGGRYEIRSAIARGGMGSVYRAWDRSLRRAVAIKILRAADAVESDAVEREIAIGSHAGHPAIVDVFDTGAVVIDRVAHRYIVMELVDAPSLQQIVAERPLELRPTAEIGAQVADALGHLHLRGILHLDIKPGNILVEPTPMFGFGRRARLIDFGIARGIDSDRRASGSAVVASAAYMSPEHVEGAAITRASDVYSLGLVLLRCITGRDEYTGTRQDAAIARLRRDPEIPEHLADGWPQLLAAMTLRRPGGRPTAHDVAIELIELTRASRQPMTTPQPLASVAVEHTRPPRLAGRLRPVSRRSTTSDTVDLRLDPVR